MDTDHDIAFYFLVVPSPSLDVEALDEMMDTNSVGMCGYSHMCLERTYIVLFVYLCMFISICLFPVTSIIPSLSSVSVSDGAAALALAKQVLLETHMHHQVNILFRFVLILLCRLTALICSVLVCQVDRVLHECSVESEREAITNAEPVELTPEQAASVLPTSHTDDSVTLEIVPALAENSVTVDSCTSLSPIVKEPIISSPLPLELLVLRPRLSNCATPPPQNDQHNGDNHNGDVHSGSGGVMSPPASMMQNDELDNGLALSPMML